MNLQGALVGPKTSIDALRRLREARDAYPIAHLYLRCGVADFNIGSSESRLRAATNKLIGRTKVLLLLYT